MLNEAFHRLITLPAAGAIPRWRCVDVNSSGQAALAGGGAVVGVGVSQETTAAVGSYAAAGQAVPLLIHGNGVTRVECGTGTITVGEQLDVDSSGRVVPHASGTIVGRALGASSAAGTIITMISGVS